jgi:twitching motility protein PilT
LREDPDVLLIGEMRDIESIQIALTMAETGHLVFATLHTNDAPQAIDRIIDVFPAWRQEQTKVQLSASLGAIVAQRLVPKVGAGWWPPSRCSSPPTRCGTSFVKVGPTSS